MHKVRQTPDFEDDEVTTGCCYGSVVYGPDRCTCWEPIYDTEQADADLSTEPTTRAKRCHDCAFRPDSPERATEDGREELEDIVGNLDRTFWCHQGMRKVIGYRHPDGREKPADPDYDSYEPLKHDAIAYNADGSAGARCAGWASARANLLKEPACG